MCVPPVAVAVWMQVVISTLGSNAIDARLSLLGIFVDVLAAFVWVTTADGTVQVSGRRGCLGVWMTSASITYASSTYSDRHIMFYDQSETAARFLECI